AAYKTFVEGLAKDNAKVKAIVLKNIESQIDTLVADLLDEFEEGTEEYEALVQKIGTAADTFEAQDAYLVALRTQDAAKDETYTEIAETCMRAKYTEGSISDEILEDRVDAAKAEEGFYNWLRSFDYEGYVAGEISVRIQTRSGELCQAAYNEAAASADNAVSSAIAGGAAYAEMGAVLAIRKNGFDTDEEYLEFLNGYSVAEMKLDVAIFAEEKTILAKYVLNEEAKEALEAEFKAQRGEDTAAYLEWLKAFDEDAWVKENLGGENGEEGSTGNIFDSIDNIFGGTDIGGKLEDILDNVTGDILDDVVDKMIENAWENILEIDVEQVPDEIWETALETMVPGLEFDNIPGVTATDVISVIQDVLVVENKVSGFLDRAHELDMNVNGIAYLMAKKIIFEGMSAEEFADWFENEYDGSEEIPVIPGIPQIDLPTMPEITFDTLKDALNTVFDTAQEVNKVIADAKEIGMQAKEVLDSINNKIESGMSTEDILGWFAGEALKETLKKEYPDADVPTDLTDGSQWAEFVKDMLADRFGTEETEQVATWALRAIEEGMSWNDVYATLQRIAATGKIELPDFDFSGMDLPEVPESVEKLTDLVNDMMDAYEGPYTKEQIADWAKEQFMQSMTQTDWKALYTKLHNVISGKLELPGFDFDIEIEDEDIPLAGGIPTIPDVNVPTLEEVYEASKEYFEKQMELYNKVNAWIQENAKFYTPAELMQMVKAYADG
ncbi:MAG: hypothetical protein IKM19_05525, partial [Firmicutes bacterium]|nr:hypothetical protein [Bacillota bacterium]